jgi:hypothetical protein
MWKGPEPGRGNGVFYCSLCDRSGCDPYLSMRNEETHAQPRHYGTIVMRIRYKAFLFLLLPLAIFIGGSVFNIAHSGQVALFLLLFSIVPDNFSGEERFDREAHRSSSQTNNQQDDAKT